MGFLAEGLARSCVRALDLSCNSLKNGGAWCLGRAYEAVGNTSLTSLNISGECAVVPSLLHCACRLTRGPPPSQHVPTVHCVCAAANTIVVGVGASQRSSVLTPFLAHLPALTSLNVAGEGAAPPVA